VWIQGWNNPCFLVLTVRNFKQNCDDVESQNRTGRYFSLIVPMTTKRLIPSFELPLIKRELIELAQRRRTYILRCVCLAVFALVFLTAYANMTSRAVNLMSMLGQGREMTAILFVTLMVTIYALAPAMACGAITSEKEKQTLGLLLISKLTPGGIVVEKMLSRMLPLLSLVIVASPLFAICYLFGGVTMSDSLMGVGLLLFVVFQISAVAVFCSALLESGIAAFWMTYFVLACLYFTWPLLIEIGILPRHYSFSGLGDEEYVLFPGYLLARFVGGSSWSQTIWLTVPSLAVTLCFPVAARFAVVWFSFGSTFSFQKRVQSTGVRTLGWFRNRFSGSTAEVDVSDSQKGEQKATSFPDARPIYWRECRRGLMNRLWVQCLAVVGLFFLEVWSLWGSRYDDDIAVLFSIVLLIVAMLLVMSLTCRLFAKEREQQTLDSLLVTPLSNREILREKISGVNRLIWVLLTVVLLTGLINVFAVRMNASTLTRTFDSLNYFGSQRQARPLSFEWLVASFMFFTCAIGNAFIYMNIVKWTAVYFGLKMNTQMKAMMATLVAILCLCFVPMLLGILALLSVGADPNDLPLWFFSSPVIVTALNEWHDLSEIYCHGWFLRSDVIVVLLNFAIYGGLMLACRAFVTVRLGTLLGRLDDDSRTIVNAGSMVVFATETQLS